MKFRIFKGPNEPSGDLVFWDHIDILRKYIIRSVLAILILAIIAFFYKEIIFDQLILAPSKTDFIAYRVLCRLGNFLDVPALCVTNIPMSLINTELGGQFRVHIVISFVSGIILAFPFIAWQFWLFVRPALKPHELKNARGMILYMSLLFTGGLLFGYYVILPLIVNFLASYELSSAIRNMITINSYISTVTTLPLILGFVFELPVLVYFLTKTGLTTPRALKKARKYSIVIILIIAGLITPSTDMFSQILVACPLYLLYEVSIWVSVRVTRKDGLAG